MSEDKYSELSVLMQYSKDLLDGVIDQDRFNNEALVHITETSVGNQETFSKFMRQLAERLVLDGEAEQTTTQPEQTQEKEPESKEDNGKGGLGGLRKKLLKLKL